MENDLLAEKYHNELEQKYYSDLAKIDREEYDELLDRLKKISNLYEDLKAGYERFKEEVKGFVRKNDISGLAEFLTNNGVKL